MREVTLERDIKEIVYTLLELIGEDPHRDGLKHTPARVEETIRYLTKGYSEDPDEVLQGGIFQGQYDEMVIVKDIDFFSLCEHHLLPFYGKCHIAYIPNKKIIGLSKVPRIVEVFSRRLQVQERLTSEIANTIKRKIEPRGVAVVIEAFHLCMMARGVEKENSFAITSAMLGRFKKDHKTRQEFLALLGRESSGRT